MGGSQASVGSGENASVITRCTGQAFIFYCEDDLSWHLAPPSAWDVIDDGRCFDNESKSYYHSLALGPTSGALRNGFEKEWHWKGVAYAHYGNRRGRITLSCINDDRYTYP